jgi:hypothetical protein
MIVFVSLMIWPSSTFMTIKRGLGVYFCCSRSFLFIFRVKYKCGNMKNVERFLCSEKAEGKTNKITKGNS